MFKTSSIDVGQIIVSQCITGSIKYNLPCFDAYNSSGIFLRNIHMVHIRNDRDVEFFVDLDKIIHDLLRGQRIQRGNRLIR